MQCFNTKTHQRRSVRLKGYDYGQSGAYFVTICAYNRECLLGEIANCRGEKSFALNKTPSNEKLFVHTKIGKIVEKCWLEIPAHYPDVILYKYVVMPNHMHGILFIDNARAKDFSPLPSPPPISQRPAGTSKTIGAIIRGFKIGVTKWARTNTNIYTVWQRNYYEHIIRSENSFEKICEYVVNNQHNWNLDQLFSNKVNP